jgi:hypothetical protein
LFQGHFLSSRFKLFFPISAKVNKLKKLILKIDSNYKFGIFETFSIFDMKEEERLLEQMPFEQMSRNLKNNIVGHDIILN